MARSASANSGWSLGGPKPDAAKLHYYFTSAEGENPNPYKDTKVPSKGNQTLQLAGCAGVDRLAAELNQRERKSNAASARKSESTSRAAQDDALLNNLLKYAEVKDLIAKFISRNGNDENTAEKEQEMYADLARQVAKKKVMPKLDAKAERSEDDLKTTVAMETQVQQNGVETPITQTARPIAPVNAPSGPPPRQISKQSPRVVQSIYEVRITQNAPQIAESRNRKPPLQAPQSSNGSN